MVTNKHVKIKINKVLEKTLTEFIFAGFIFANSQNEKHSGLSTRLDYSLSRTKILVPWTSMDTKCLEPFQAYV